jgi:hypothetical protein
MEFVDERLMLTFIGNVQAGIHIFIAQPPLTVNRLIANFQPLERCNMFERFSFG